MASSYGGVVWTNHALSRLKDRKLGQSLVLKAFLHPDTKTKADQGAVKYQKKIGERMVSVITKKGDDKKQLILSCWIDPPLAGSLDDKKRQSYLKYKKSGFWGRVWLEVKRGFGLN
jgi:hypothetical protein